jgi:hypothetical protein
MFNEKFFKTRLTLLHMGIIAAYVFLTMGI